MNYGSPVDVLVFWAVVFVVGYCCDLLMQYVFGHVFCFDDEVKVLVHWSASG